MPSSRPGASSLVESHLRVLGLGAGLGLFVGCATSDVQTQPDVATTSPPPATSVDPVPANAAPSGTWEPLHQAAGLSLRGLSVASDGAIWASGTAGTVLRSVDGGETFGLASVDAAAELDLRDIQAFDTDRALAISAGLPAKIFKTVDGGKSWKERYSNETPGIFFDAMAFWDDGRGLAMSDPVDGRFFVITTEDGGETWSSIDPAGMPLANEGEAGFAGSGTCLAVAGRRYAWFGTGGSVARVFRSEDRGRSWEAVEVPLRQGQPSQGVFSLAFADALRGVAVGGDYKDEGAAQATGAWTLDGGRTWVPMPTGPSGFREAAVFAGDFQSVITVGPQGSDRSLDGGRHFSFFGELKGLHTAAFSPETATVWAAGADGLIARMVVGN